MESARTIALMLGTRPEAIKLGPVHRGLLSEGAARHLRPVVIVTGQHRQLVDQMLPVFGMEAAVDLDVMTEGQTPASLTGSLVPRLQETLEEQRPDLVMVQGDTTTVLCAALAAFYCQIPVAHLEAGLRTSSKYSPFPEEINRRLTSHIADVHLAPTRRARHNLQAEGIDPQAIFVTGNTIVDAVQWVAQRAPDLADTEFGWVKELSGRTVLVTVHRRENLGVPFTSVCLAFLELVERYPDLNVVFPMHPNPHVRKAAGELLGSAPRVHLCEPPDYLVFVALMQCADMIITDSGGIQEEAPALGVPVLVVRETTERPEGIQAGVTKLVGTQTEDIVREAAALLDNPSAYEAMASGGNPYGDGKAAARVIMALEHFFGLREERPADFDWQQPDSGDGPG
jgi:UDP-N-acetylglucosamine 2-epimerase (non-hydrolysing)